VPYQAMVKTRELHLFECPTCKRTERRLVSSHNIGPFLSERMGACRDGISAVPACNAQTDCYRSKRLDASGPGLSQRSSRSIGAAQVGAGQSAYVCSKGLGA
jgi:hypothetical protein